MEEVLGRFICRHLFHLPLGRHLSQLLLQCSDLFAGTPVFLVRLPQLAVRPLQLSF